jgi:4-alpha-glucanotransferase
MTVWQTLPIGPRDGTGSPYQSPAVFAGDPQLLDPELLAELGLISTETWRAYQQGELGFEVLIEMACHRFMTGDFPELQVQLADYSAQQAYWLDDYALYRTLRDHLQAPWYDWPTPLRDREPQALTQARQDFAMQLMAHRLGQFFFDWQWRQLRAYAHEHGIYLFGDLPIFVAHDSADVWAHRQYFQLTAEGGLAVNTGVPPDYFSADGQLWCMPHYSWPALAAEDYSWWIERMRRQRQFFDLIRIDHFRGFEAAWEVPMSESTARCGHWQPGPGRALFEALSQSLGAQALVAEDLGYITEAVDALRRSLHLPGMRVLQFAFDGDAANPHLPHNHEPNMVVYTGTHDNDTASGWWHGVDEAMRQRVAEYLDTQVIMPTTLNRCALASVARLAILPLQDVLGLDSQARMNKPGTCEDNWHWRYTSEQLRPDLASQIRHLVEIYGRLPTARAE